jgi:PIN domain nuclease of toxin-antitoxin system
MRLLLDTHVFIWSKREPERLSKRVISLFKSRESRIMLSAVTAWEIAVKTHNGKLDFDKSILDDFENHVAELGFDILTVTPRHAITGARLPGAHKDPFDRILAGQARCENLAIITSDPAFMQLGVETMW